MIDMTNNEMKAMLVLFREFGTEYNANSLAKRIGLSSMGVLKILKGLERQGLVKSRKLGRAVFYRPDLSSDYACSYLIFAMQREAEQAVPGVRRWVVELRKLSDSAETGILFGSVLEKDSFNDIDVLLVLDRSQSRKADKAIEGLDKVNVKKVHAVRQTRSDLVANLRKQDRVVLDIIRKGVVLFGYDVILEVLKDASR